MTPQESQMLNDLIAKVQRTQLGQKDPEAEQLLAEGLGNDPEAVYILAQTVLVQDLALRQAKAQLDQLRQQTGQTPARPTSFLGNLFHRDQAPPSPVAPQQPPQYQAQPQYQPVSYSQVPYQGPPPFAQQQPVFVEQPSFLRSAATTAAGVAAGALAFEGIESLLHGGHGGFGPGWGYGGGMPMEMPMGGRPEETIINNYYDSPGGMGEHHEHDLGMGGDQDALRERHEHEANYDDRPGDAANLHDASYDPSGDVSYDDRQTQDLDNAQLDDVSMLSGDDAQFGDGSFGDDSGFDSGGDLGGDTGGGFDGGDDLA